MTCGHQCSACSVIPSGPLPDTSRSVHPFSGRRSPSDRLTASAALLKAVLIQSAILQPSDDVMKAGFGRLDLSTVLYFPSSSHNLLVYAPRSGGGLDTGSRYVQCVGVSASSDAPLKATVVWTDPEAALVSGFHLVNDLDLLVQALPPSSYFPLLSPTLSLSIRIPTVPCAL